MIARNKAFVVPVCIDLTPDSGADVPDSFHKVQWTRLPGGEFTAAFGERIKVLLGGVEGTAGPRSADTPAPTSPLKRTSYRWKIVAAASVLVALVGGWQAWRLTTSKPKSQTARTSATTAVAVPEKSIAVLPFVDMSEKHDQEYFSDGLSEELIDHLSHIPDLKVIARTSSFAFKGKNEDMRLIATKLAVANLLEGSVRKEGQELRITAQLIRAADGVHLWSQSFDRKMTDVFKIQEEISQTVAKALNAALGGRPASTDAGTTNIAAYNFLLKGNYIYWRGNSGDNAKSIDLYKEAIKLDPNYALAWVQLARAYLSQGLIGEVTVVVAESSVRAALKRALALDPKSAKAHSILGSMLHALDWDRAGAKSEFDRAIALDTGGEETLEAREWLAMIAMSESGRFEDLTRVLLEKLSRNPLDTDTLYVLGQVQNYAGELPDSASTYRRLLELNPVFVQVNAYYGQTLLFMGRHAEALAAAQREPQELARLGTLPIIYWAMGRRAESNATLRDFEKKFGDVGAYYAADCHAYRGEADLTFVWLERAYQQREQGVLYLKVDPFLRNLHSDPRFKAVLRKMKLPE